LAPESGLTAPTQKFLLNFRKIAIPRVGTHADQQLMAHNLK
jgi:hypothetical protein